MTTAKDFVRGVKAAERKRKGHVEREYRLASTSMINAPGILRWAINGYKFKKDRQKMLNVMKAWEGTPDNPGPTEDIFKRLLAGEIQWREENGTVIFTA